jgi:hypothetical protein
MEPSMWHSTAIRWIAAYGPQVQEACGGKQWVDLNKMESWNFEVKKLAYHRQDAKRQFKNKQQAPYP